MAVLTSVVMVAAAIASPKLEMSLSLDKAVCLPYEPIYAVATVRNRASSTVTIRRLNEGSVSNAIKFTILSSVGKKMAARPVTSRVHVECRTFHREAPDARRGGRAQGVPRLVLLR